MIIAIYLNLFEVVMYEYGVTQKCTLYLNVTFCLNYVVSGILQMLKHWQMGALMKVGMSLQVLKRMWTSTHVGVVIVGVKNNVNIIEVV